MKKPIALLLVMVICLSLCACGGNQEEVKNALQGTWTAKWTYAGMQISRYYTFKGNTYTTGGVAIFGEVQTETGTFEVMDTCIRLTPDDGSSAIELDYTYNEKTGIVSLWWNDDVQFQSGTVSVQY